MYSTIWSPYLWDWLNKPWWINHWPTGVYPWYIKIRNSLANKFLLKLWGNKLKRKSKCDWRTPPSAKKDKSWFITGIQTKFDLVGEGLKSVHWSQSYKQLTSRICKWSEKSSCKVHVISWSPNISQQWTPRNPWSPRCRARLSNGFCCLGFGNKRSQIDFSQWIKLQFSRSNYNHTFKTNSIWA